MKKVIQFARGVLLRTVLLLPLSAAAVAAQATGTVALSGTVSAVTRITSGGAATLSGSLGGGVTTQSAVNVPLATVVDFGDVGPGNSNTYVCFTQPIFLRSNAAASLRAAVTASSFGAGPGVLQRSDIGIGLRNLAAGGVNASIATSTIVPIFAADPCAAPVTNGIPAFSATLASLATVTPGTTVMSATGAWSVRGSLNAASNRVLLDLKLAIVPQAFSTGPFSATLTLTVTSP
jgi:hypothetical protein